MKKNLFRNQTQFILVAIAPVFITLFGLFMFYQSTVRTNSLSEIKYGVNLCFTRLTQSVIALQSHDYFSKHLERSYIDFTNECFFEFKEKIKNSFVSQESEKLVDQLLEDSQTLSKAIVNVLGLKQVEVTKGSIQSQILPNYSKVDYSRFNLNQWIKQQESNSGVFTWQNILFFIAMFLLNSFLIYFIIREKSNYDKIGAVEEKAKNLLQELEFHPHKLEIFLSDVLEKYNLENCQNVFKRYLDGIIQQSQLLAKMKGIKVENEIVENWQETSQVKTQEADQPPSLPLIDNHFDNALENELKIDTLATWTMEDEEADILNNNQSDELNTEYESIVPTHEPLCSLSEVLSATSQTLLNNNVNSTIVHSAGNAPFWLKGDHEHFEQLFIALINKIEQRFNEFSVDSANRCINIEYSFDDILGQAEIGVIAKGALFHIDDLEYFHDSDHLTVDSYNVIVKEMVKELYGEIIFKNLIGDDLEDNSLKIVLKVPVKRKEIVANAGAKLVNVIKGKKKDIITIKPKEISV